MPSLKDLKIKLFADGADKAGMLELYKNPLVSGFTTNPTLMAKAGVKDYEAYAKDILSHIADRPISFEVFSDDMASMEREARKIKTWGKNVYVKIPVQNTKGESCAPLVKKLSEEGTQLNITALTLTSQVDEICRAVKNGAPSFISVFAGRVADTGVDPIPLMTESAAICKQVPKAELLWASTRELYNIFQAQQVGCKIITAPNDIIKKLAGGGVGKDLAELSLEIVKIFLKDSTSAGFKL